MEYPSRRGQWVTRVDRMAWVATERKVRSNGMPHAGYANPSRTTDMDPIRTYPIGAPQTHHSSHRGNFTKPPFYFLMHDHSSILMHAFIHSSHTFKHCICNCCITTLRVASQSGSRLIRYERRPTRVQRPAHKGLEVTSCQIEPGGENVDEPQWPSLDPLRSGQGHLDLLVRS